MRRGRCCWTQVNRLRKLHGRIVDKGEPLESVFPDRVCALRKITSFRGEGNWKPGRFQIWLAGKVRPSWVDEKDLP